MSVYITKVNFNVGDYCLHNKNHALRMMQMVLHRQIKS